MVSMTFPAEACVLNFLLARDDGCFHCIDSLTLWFIMVHPGLVSCHISMEKTISFTSMTVQMLLTNRLLCTLVIIGQLPWDPSATHFLIPEVIMGNIVSRAVTMLYATAISSIVTRL